jgi:hypothetical protein
VGARGFIEYCLSSLFDSVFDASSFTIKEKANASLSNKGVDVCLDILPHVSKAQRTELNRMFFSEFSSTKFGKAKFFNEFHRKLIKTSCHKDNSILFDSYICRSAGNIKYSMKEVQQYWLN